MQFKQKEVLQQSGPGIFETRISRWLNSREISVQFLVSNSVNREERSEICNKKIEHDTIDRSAEKKFTNKRIEQTNFILTPSNNNRIFAAKMKILFYITKTIFVVSFFIYVFQSANVRLVTGLIEIRFGFFWEGGDLFSIFEFQRF